MIKPRITSASDRTHLKALWQTCFNDSESFAEWFFQCRFSPAHSVCLEIDHKIVSAMHSLPMHIKIRNKILPCAILSGFSTLPSYRRRGYMGQCFSFLSKMLRESGVIVLPHTPAVLESYFSLGHYPVSNTAYFTSETTPFIPFPDGIVSLDPKKDDISPLWRCYQLFSYKYSGIILRSMADFQLKAADYASDSGQILAVFQNNHVQGYTFYYNTDTLVYGEEIIALNHETEQLLALGLQNLAANKKLFLKFPPDTQVQLSGIEKTIQPMGVMGACHVPLLLETLGCGLDFVISVQDCIIQENNGIFNFKGQSVSNRKPHISLDAGHLLQFLLGYCSLSELEEQNHAVLLDKEAAKQLDLLFPKQICFIIDKY